VRPNIVVILADDMGFSDIGCFGSEIRTPTLDALAAGGVRFTQMYSCARCCPSRASLLTGLHPHQAGVGHMIQDRGVGPAYQGFLRDDCLTLGEVLRPAGYRTLYAGKWHVSPGLPVLGEPVAPVGSARNPSPLSRGFDRFYGTLAGCGNYFNPHGLMDQDRRIRAEDPVYYYTDALTDRACGMVREAAALGSPFFLHVCYTAPHWPLHAWPEDVARCEGRYDGGWDAVRAGRLERLRAMGIVDSRWPLSPRDAQSRDFHADRPERRAWEASRMEVYAAQVEAMDRAIGGLVQTLRAAGVLDDTLLLFLSDNGGCAEYLNEDGDGKSWPSVYRHTARPGETCTVGNIAGMRPGPATTFMSYDLPWANASNTPFRRYKHWVHEGGIASPSVAHWPRRAAAGALIHRPCHFVDLMATCVELAGASYPRSTAGRAIQPMAGESMVPALTGRDTERERPLFWEHEGNRAVRDGRWKAVQAHGGPWELYCMEVDRTETRDLASTEPARLRRMIGDYEAWAASCGVRPWPLDRRA
jgi:arylsulfatase A-like enzyme